MNSTMDANRKRIEDFKRRRLQRLQSNANESMETSMSDARAEGRQRSWSVSKSQLVHVAGTLVQTYDMEIQCQFETRSLDSKAPAESEEETHIDLLQPREKKRKEETKKEDPVKKQVQQLNNEELNTVIKSKPFNQFFQKSSKFVEKMLDNDNAQMIEVLLREGVKSKGKADGNIITHSLTYADPNYTHNRVVTDLDWNAQLSQLFLASYSQNEEGSIKDHVGLALVWNPQLRTRPEFYCFCQSAVTSARFFPFSNDTVLGGCFNGQLVVWDLRAKTMPVLRSGVAPQSHKYPVNSLNVVGTQITNNVASFSNDGILCLWDVKQFNKPVKSVRLTATQPTRTARQSKTTLMASTNPATKPILGTATFHQKTVKEEAYEINVMCGRFPHNDANNYYLGSLNGALYKNALHNVAADKVVMYDEHNGPISALAINSAPEHQALNGLVLSSSFDWTVKMWSPHHAASIRTFEHSEDFVYDIAWNPKNPSLFATVNNEGYVDLFDLTRDMELPIAREKVNNYSQNKMVWNTEGSLLATGDSVGSLHLYVLAEKYRHIDNSKYDHLQRYLAPDHEDLP